MPDYQVERYDSPTKRVHADSFRYVSVPGDTTNDNQQIAVRFTKDSDAVLDVPFRCVESVELIGDSDSA